MLFIISVDSYSRIARRQVGSGRVDNSQISLLICDLDLFHCQGFLSSRWWSLIYRFKISHTCILKFFSPIPSLFFSKLFQNATVVSHLYLHFTSFKQEGFHCWLSTFYRIILTHFCKVLSFHLLNLCLDPSPAFSPGVHHKSSCRHLD